MLEKVKEHFFEIVSCLVGAIGAIATVIAGYATVPNGYLTVFISILAVDIIVVFIGVWNLVIKYSYEREKSDFEDKIKALENTLTEERLKCEEIEKKYSQMKKDECERAEIEKKEAQKRVSTIISNLKNASKLNNELCNRIPAIGEKSYRVLETLQDSGIENDEVLKGEIIHSYQDFSISLFDLYKRYSTNLLLHVVSMVEAYLELQGHRYRVSATVKLFDRPFCQKDNDRSSIVVYTAFRDKRTYDEHEREIGQVPYSIDGNVDFSLCLQKDQFIINNARKDSENYLNEHKDFDAYYNCAVVVAIRIKQADNTYKFLGYLCCDCMNKTPGVEVFDKEVAQILFSMAQLYGNFSVE